jgi:hypothetical protein
VKKRPRTKPICDLDENHEMEIGHVIYDMVKNKKHITKFTLLRVLKAKHLFQGGASSLGKVLKGIGFRFRKDDPRRGLIELPRIALSWLQERHIPFTSELLKVQLLEMVTRHKPAKKYKADEFALKYGHKVLRLPPYHCFDKLSHLSKSVQTGENS